MIDFPFLSICLQTYARTEEALATLRYLCMFLGYEKHLRGFYIADDGSKGEHVNILLDELKERGEKVIGHHSERFSPHTGVGFNKGMGICFQSSDFVLVMEDDWVLKDHFDIHPYVEMLTQCDGTGDKPNVGMVRLGGLAVGNNVEIVGWNGHHYLRYYRDRQYAYSGNPHIKHARFIKAYGWYSDEKLNPGELELDYDGRFRSMSGPDIWRPADIPGWGIFNHIGAKVYR